MPDGIPDVIYNNPEEFGLVDKGWDVSLEELQAVAEVSGVLSTQEDYIPLE